MQLALRPLNQSARRSAVVPLTLGDFEDQRSDPGLPNKSADALYGPSGAFTFT